MRGLRPLQRLELLLNAERSRDHNHRHMRRDLLEARQKLYAQFAVPQDVIEKNDVGNHRFENRQCGGSIRHASEAVTGQRLSVQFDLLRIVFDNQNGGSKVFTHSGGYSARPEGALGILRSSFAACPWSRRASSAIGTRMRNVV